MTSLGVQITKRIEESRERTAIQAGKLLLHVCIPLMVKYKSILGSIKRSAKPIGKNKNT